MILGNLLLTSRLKHITIYSAAELKYSINPLAELI